MPDHPMAALATVFNFHTGSLKAIAQRLDSDADWRKPIAPDTSSAYWLFGHLATYRRALVATINGTTSTMLWDGKFVRDTHPSDELVPAPADVLAELVASGDEMAARMVQLSDEALAADCGRPMRTGDRTVRGMLHFMQFHEAYHIGQLGLIVKGLGKPPLVTPGK
ncbi:MAG: DinB family protein [Planctomycetota bacterium]